MSRAGRTLVEAFLERVSRGAVPMGGFYWVDPKELRGRANAATAAAHAPALGGTAAAAHAPALGATSAAAPVSALAGSPAAAPVSALAGIPATAPVTAAARRPDAAPAPTSASATVGKCS